MIAFKGRGRRCHRSLEGVERELRGALVVARDECGVKISRRRFGVTVDGSGRIVLEPGGGCCALGAWALVKRLESQNEGRRVDIELIIGAAVSAAFGWGTGAYSAFMQSFDGRTCTNEYAAAHAGVVALAERLAKEFVTSRARS